MADKYPEPGEVWIKRGRRGPVMRIYVVTVHDGHVLPLRNTSRRTQRIAVKTLLNDYRREASLSLVMTNPGRWAGWFGPMKHRVYRELEALKEAEGRNDG